MKKPLSATSNICISLYESPAGDSYNDIQMFEVADKGFFINAPVKISSEYPEIPSYNSYDDLEIAFKENSHFIK